MAIVNSRGQPGSDAPSAAPVSLKERQRQEREHLILAAAMDLLIEKGYHEMSMDELAARVGISKGAVYLHFASKEELISALVERGARQFGHVLEEALAESGTPREKLSRVLQQIYGDPAGKRFQVMRAMSQSPELYRLMAEKHQALAALWEEPSRHLAAVIDEGKRRGEFDCTLPTPLVLSLMSSLLSPHGFQQLVTRGGMPVEVVVAHLTRYFFKGIAADDPTAMRGDNA